jgi:hypothetical protein
VRWREEEEGWIEARACFPGERVNKQKNKSFALMEQCLTVEGTVARQRITDMGVRR